MTDYSRIKDTVKILGAFDFVHRQYSECKVHNCQSRPTVCVKTAQMPSNMSKWITRRKFLQIACISLPFIALYRIANLLKEASKQLDVAYDPSPEQSSSLGYVKVPPLKRNAIASAHTQRRQMAVEPMPIEATNAMSTRHASRSTTPDSSRVPLSNATALEQSSALQVRSAQAMGRSNPPTNPTNTPNNTLPKTGLQISAIRGAPGGKTTSPSPQNALVKGVNQTRSEAWKQSLSKQGKPNAAKGQSNVTLQLLQKKPPDKIRVMKVTGPVNPIREKRIIYLMHIHKNAGSTMCKAAIVNKVPANDTLNCNVQTDQRCCGYNDTLAAQQYFARTTNLSFVAAERDMYQAMDTEHYRYIIVLRKAHDRYLSHYKHVVRSVRYNYTFAYWWGGQPDNFSFRKVCGTACSTVPKYQITPALFNYTLGRLAQFEDFIFQEDFRNSYMRFAQRVGWQLAPAAIHNKSPKVKPGRYPGLTGWDPHMGALENAMYEYAQQRYRGVAEPVFSDSVAADLQSYFAMIPLRNCTLPCCAEKCSTYR
jgi:hypothetical protein